MTATVFFADDLAANFFATRVGGDVTPVPGPFPWAVTFNPLEAL